MRRQDGKVWEGLEKNKTERLRGGVKDRCPGAVSREFPGVSRLTYFGLGSATTVGYVITK